MNEVNDALCSALTPTTTLWVVACAQGKNEDGDDTGCSSLGVFSSREAAEAERDRWQAFYESYEPGRHVMSVREHVLDRSEMDDSGLDAK